MRLNLGCGGDIKVGYVNVDLKKREGVDLVADIMTLSFPPETFTEILAADIIEHIYYCHAKKLLRNCYKWLKPHGILTIHTSNMPFLAKHLADGGDYADEFHFEVLKWVYGIAPAGESDSPYMVHYWSYSEESLCYVLRQIGFSISNCKVDCDGFGLFVSAYKKE